MTRIPTVSLVLLLVGCASADNPVAPIDGLPFQLIGNFGFSDRIESGLELARTQEELVNIWSSLARLDLDPPAVDIGKEMVFAYFLGDRGSGGYWPEVEKIISRPGMIDVFVIEHQPGPRCRVAEAASQPVVFVKTHLRQGKMRVSVRIMVTKCG